MVGVLDPGFFFSEIARPFEVSSCPHSNESQPLQFLDQFVHCGSDGGMRSALNGKGFVGDLGRVSGRRSIDEDGATKIPVARIDSFNLVFLDQPLFLENQRQDAHSLLHNLPMSYTGEIIGAFPGDCNRVDKGYPDYYDASPHQVGGLLPSPLP